jgi:hypothetical protein
MHVCLASVSLALPVIDQVPASGTRSSKNADTCSRTSKCLRLVEGPVGCDTKRGQRMDRKPRRTTFNPFGSICKLLLLGYVLVFIAVFLWLSSPLVVSLLSFPLHFLGSAATRLGSALLCILDLLLRWPLQYFSHQVCIAAASPLASAIDLGLNFLSGSSWHRNCVYFVISPP